MTPMLLALATVTSSPTAPALPGAAGQDAADECAGLVRELERELRVFEAELARRRAAGEATADFQRDWSPLPAYVDLFAERAGAYAGREDAVPFLLWIADRAPAAEPDALPAPAAAALDTLLEDHGASPALAAHVSRGGQLVLRVGEPRALAQLDHLIAAAPPTALLVPALLSRVVVRLHAGVGGSEEARRCRADIERLRALGPPEVVRQLDGLLHELEHLQVGSAAPELEGPDLDGGDLRLSDLRGRVVVLLFWADWCPLCREEYPGVRALIERHADEPLTVLGVNNDPDPGVLAERRRRGELPWRSFWNGPLGPFGPISASWNVTPTTWPASYVIDAQGIIRHIDVRGAALDDAVEELLAELRED